MGEKCELNQKHIIEMIRESTFMTSIIMYYNFHFNIYRLITI